MSVLAERRSPARPRVSIILLDWSCRESFHILDYLERQTAPRSSYEIVWIEYYDRRIAAVERRVDQAWVLGLPKDLYYHKHLMYNAGIVCARGEIIVICDSDAMVRPTFVESIVSAFDAEAGIVLHLDQVRNVDRALYPFRYPSFERVQGPGALNWRDGKTVGLLDVVDPLHSRNYGACFCARREDLIAIGGADEHIDYLGHVCGPYEMTFRLVNAGKRERWHETEFLYHTWHPGTDGHDNYLGPHDGRNVSTTALGTIRTGRIEPLVENSAIRLLREQPEATAIELRESLIPWRDFSRWRRRTLLPSQEMRLPEWRLAALAAKTTLKQTLRKAASRLSRAKERRAHPSSTDSVMKRSVLDRISLALRFVGRAWQNNLYAIEACRQVVGRLRDERCEEAAVYGRGELAQVLLCLLRDSRMRVVGPFDEGSLSSLRGFRGKIVVASMLDVARSCAELAGAGVDPISIVRLQ